MDTALDLFVACLPGLEPWCAREFAATGLVPADSVREQSGGLALRGDLHDAFALCLHLGTASHVLVRLAEFPCHHLAELRRRCDRIDWTRWLPRNARLEVRATTRRTKLYHSGAVAERVELALREQLGPAPEPATDGSAPLAILVRVEGETVTISCDAAGAPLHRQGWRLEGAKAPLREDLAHALVLASGWDPSMPFVDPFCGSGTLPIVAARIAAGRLPGEGRTFAVEQLCDFDAERAAALRGSVAAGHREVTVPIGAADRDAGAVAATRANAERADVAAALEVVEGNWRDAPGLVDPGAVGAVVSNPPFGKRVGDARLVNLWQSIGAVLGRLPEGWRLALLSADRRLALRTGLPLKTAFLTRHGGLGVRAMVRGAAVD